MREEKVYQIIRKKQQVEKDLKEKVNFSYRVKAIYKQKFNAKTLIFAYFLAYENLVFYTWL